METAQGLDLPSLELERNHSRSGHREPFSKAEDKTRSLPHATKSLLGVSASTASPESHLKGLGPMVLGSDRQCIL